MDNTNVKQKGYHEVIDETVAAYTRDTRSFIRDEDGYVICQYITPKGKRCALSRCCDPAMDDKLANLEGKSSTDVFQMLGESVLKPEYRGLHQDFWDELQALHDNGYYWNEDGLSQCGKGMVDELKRIWK